MLSGDGPCFSAGHDLSSTQQQADVARDGAPLAPFDRGLLSRDIYTDSHLRWRDLPKPTIAMVHGLCLFGGWMIAAAMDIVFAADDAILPRHLRRLFHDRMGRRPAQRRRSCCSATSSSMLAKRKRAGLVNRVISPDRLEPETIAFAERTARQDPQRNRLIKFAINQAQDAMGFTTSVRAVGAAFITRAYPNPAKRWQDGPLVSIRRGSTGARSSPHSIIMRSGMFRETRHDRFFPGCAWSNSDRVSRSPSAASCSPTSVPRSSRFEPPEGDLLRRMPPLVELDDGTRDSAYFAWLNTNKSSVVIRLSRPRPDRETRRADR